MLVVGAGLLVVTGAGDGGAKVTGAGDGVVKSGIIVTGARVWGLGVGLMWMIGYTVVAGARM